MGNCNKNLAARLVAEFVGSMLVQCIGCFYSGPTVESFAESIGNIFNPNPPAKPVEAQSPVAYAFGWGGLIIVGTMAFRIVSGAHLNPIISVASMIVKNIKVMDGILYILMQLAGSCLGYLIAFAMFGNFFSKTKFCVTTVTVDPFWKALLIEFFISGAWVLAFCASVHESQEPPNESVSLKIGFVCICATLVGVST